MTVFGEGTSVPTRCIAFVGEKPNIRMDCGHFSSAKYQIESQLQAIGEKLDPRPRRIRGSDDGACS